ncbi:MAG: MFS transporter, partial [Acidobacteriota bacterium]
CLHRLLVIIGPGASGTMICLIGLAPGYGALTILLLTMGCSIAALHVSAPVLISEVAGGRVGRAMSFFMVAGELARTVGPLIAVQLVSLFGLAGIWRVIPIALASSLLLWWRLGGLTPTHPTARPSPLFSVWKQMWVLLVGVLGVVISRAFMLAGLTTFLPTFIYGEGESLWMANISLAVLQLAGAAGALTAGTLSDKIGRRRVLLGAMALSPPLMVLFLIVAGRLRLLVLMGLGFVALSTAPVLMAVVIENAGSNRAAANGTYFMISFSARSLIILAVGAMGDAVGLRTTYLWCAGLAVLGLPFLLLLPSNARR